MNPRRLVLILAAAATLALGGAALAASDFQTSFSDSGTFNWDGGTASSVAPLFDGTTCTSQAPAGRYCEKTLIELKTAGTLAITIDGWNENSDLDLFLATSDADGTWGEDVTDPPLGEGPGPEKITAKNLKPGFYIVGVNYFQAVQTNYKGSVVFTAAGGSATPTPGPTSTPAPGSGGSGGPTPAPLVTSGKLAVEVAVDKAKLRSVRSKGVGVRVGCTVACKGTVSLVVSKKTAKKLKISRRIGSGSFKIDNKGQAALKVRLTSKTRKRLAKAKSLKLTAQFIVTDSSGGQKTSASKSATFRK